MEGGADERWLAWRGTLVRTNLHRPKSLSINTFKLVASGGATVAKTPSKGKQDDKAESLNPEASCEVNFGGEKILLPFDHSSFYSISSASSVFSFCLLTDEVRLLAAAVVTDRSCGEYIFTFHLLLLKLA